jgi:hypothetical protein
VGFVGFVGFGFVRFADSRLMDVDVQMLGDASRF